MKSDLVETGSQQRPRLLIVEDEALLAMDMETTLESNGMDVVGIADTEEEALREVRALSPDIVLMDIRLRSGDGISAARAIMNMGRVCVIFVSGNSDPNTYAAASQLRPAGWIRKPYDANRLPGLVLEAYQRFRKSFE